MSTEADWDHWMEVIADEGVNLTNWEADFMDSLMEQREQGRRLTERQAEILERIYSEKTP